MNIKFARDGQEIGEYPEEAVPDLLQAKVLWPTDYFWHEGLPKWEPIETKWNRAAFHGELRSLPPTLRPQPGQKPRTENREGAVNETVKKVARLAYGTAIFFSIAFILGAYEVKRDDSSRGPLLLFAVIVAIAWCSAVSIGWKKRRLMWTTKFTFGFLLLCFPFGTILGKRGLDWLKVIEQQFD